MPVRHAFVLLHRYVGLATAVFLFVAGIGGSVAAFQEELDATLNPAFFVAATSGPALAPSELARRIEAAEAHAQLRFLPLARPPGEALRVYVEPKHDDHVLAYDEVAVDPATGAVQGRRLWGACCFERQNLVSFLYRLHYSLALPGALGNWIVGCVAIAWFLDCFVGLYLTLPRAAPFWPKWRKRWTITTSAGSGRLIYDGHNAVGLWPWLLLAVLAMSAIAMNLAAEVFKPAVSLVATVTPPPVFEAAAGGERRIDWDEAISLAVDDAGVRGWTAEPQWIYWAGDELRYHVGFDVRDPDRRDDGSRRELAVDADSGAVDPVRDPAARTGGDVFIDLQYPLHTGRLLGFPGRVLIAIAGLATALLTVTGVWLWLRRCLRGTARHPRIR